MLFMVWTETTANIFMQKEWKMGRKLISKGRITCFKTSNKAQLYMQADGNKQIKAWRPLKQRWRKHHRCKHDNSRIKFEVQPQKKKTTIKKTKQKKLQLQSTTKLVFFIAIAAPSEKATFVFLKCWVFDNEFPWSINHQSIQ